MDFVNFEVGSKTVSLAILNILLTEQYRENLTEMPNHNPNFMGIKDFMNIPVPIFDLGKILNHCSTKDKNTQTVNQFLEQKNIFNQWLLSNKGNNVLTKPHALLKWLNNFTSSDEDLASIMSKAKLIVEQIVSKNISDDNKLNSKVNQLFENAIEHIEYSYKPIIVFTTINGSAPHIGLLVDKVEDNIHVNESDIKSLDKVTTVGFELDNDTKAILKGLIQLGDKHSLIIDPASLFTKGIKSDEVQTEAVV